MSPRCPQNFLFEVLIMLNKDKKISVRISSYDYDKLSLLAKLTYPTGSMSKLINHILSSYVKGIIFDQTDKTH